MLGEQETYLTVLWFVSLIWENMIKFLCIENITLLVIGTISSIT